MVAAVATAFLMWSNILVRTWSSKRTSRRLSCGGGPRSVQWSFSEFGGGRAFFDQLEGMRLVGGTEEVGSVAPFADVLK